VLSFGFGQQPGAGFGLPHHQVAVFRRQE
jgi:hypothetical protein